MFIQNQFRPETADEVTNAFLGILLPRETLPAMVCANGADEIRLDLTLFPQISSDLVADLVRCCGRLCNLHLTSIAAANIETISSCFRNSTIDHLYLDRVPTSLFAAQTLPDHLRRLSLTTERSATAHHLLDILRSCPALESFDFGMIGDDVVLDTNIRIGELQLNRLTHFGVSYVPCFDKTFLSLLSKCPNLSSIIILWCPISATAMCEVISGRESWPALRFVHFRQLSELLVLDLEDQTEGE